MEVDGAEQEQRGSTRRGVLAGVGLIGVAGAVAACGGSDEAGGDDAGSGDPGGAPAAGGTVLAKTSEIPVGGGKIFEGQKVVVTQPTQGEFKAFSTECTHRKCPVDEIRGSEIICPCHGSKFKITDGSKVAGPPPQSGNGTLATRNIKVEGDSISLA
ncbi:Rieske (2Fe-2S) protein [Actinomadura craniellae]|nr:Rieske (2Fe-2S) protein [Actinomadura craniellae]